MLERSHLLAVKEIPTITPSLSRSTVYTRPNWSVGTGRGRTSKTSSGDPGVPRLVQPPTAPHRLRRPPTNRVRSHLLPWPTTGYRWSANL